MRSQLSDMVVVPEYVSCPLSTQRSHRRASAGSNSEPSRRRQRSGLGGVPAHGTALAQAQEERTRQVGRRRSRRVRSTRGVCMVLSLSWLVGVTMKTCGLILVILIAGCGDPPDNDPDAGIAGD